MISEPKDVFWLHLTEIDRSLGGLADQVEQRKQVWRGQLRATPPQLLPQGRLGRHVLASWMPAASDSRETWQT